ncbi:transposase zinc-binding domain-containing protein, partial [Anaerobranca gottschalkii]
MATGIIKQIFEDKWGEFKEKYPIRPTVLSEVKKMLTCKDMSEGYSKFCCPTCNEVRYVGFTCKSHFCTSCGRKATEQWVEKLSKELF